MAKQRFVWRGKRRQVLRALHKQLDRVQNRRDPHFKEEFQVFISTDANGNFGKLLIRAALCLQMKENIPTVPKVTP